MKEEKRHSQFWIFWKQDFTKRVDVKWNGETPFADIITLMKEKLGHGFRYERNSQVKPTPKVNITIK